jgi:hypothetical protein
VVSWNRSQAARRPLLPLIARPVPGSAGSAALRPSSWIALWASSLDRC